MVFPLFHYFQKPAATVNLSVTGKRFSFDPQLDLIDGLNLGLYYLMELQAIKKESPFISCRDKFRLRLLN